MASYQEIMDAKRILGLPDRASREEIKSRYRNLLNRWHPDKCPDKDKDGQEKCIEMTRKIISAYEVIIAYCDQYKYSFEKDEIKKSLSGKNDWWFERFGNDPVWGNYNDEK